MAEPAAPDSPFSERTAWARNLETPLRQFLRTETGSAAVLLAATVIALAWVNIDSSAYGALWGTHLMVRLGGGGVSQDLHGWVNSGLMTFFFLVVGLEARREFDMGELRDRRRVTLPLLAGVGGMIVPIAIYLIANAGAPSARGWGAAMSTDTPLAVVDGLVALGILPFAYSGHINGPPLLIGLAILGVVFVLRRAGFRNGLIYALLGVAAWIALFKSGIDPVVDGLAIGLMTCAYPAPRADLERATKLFRLFREQPTPELARSASTGLTLALSPNERLQQL